MKAEHGEVIILLEEDLFSQDGEWKIHLQDDNKITTELAIMAEHGMSVLLAWCRANLFLLKY